MRNRPDHQEAIKGATVEAIVEGTPEYHTIELERKALHTMRELHPRTAHLVATSGYKYGSLTTQLVAWRGEQAEPELAAVLLQNLSTPEQADFFYYGRILPQAQSWKYLVQHFPRTNSPENASDTNSDNSNDHRYLEELWNKANRAIAPAAEQYLTQTISFYHTIQQLQQYPREERALEFAYAESKDPLVRTLLLEKYLPWIYHTLGKIRKRIPPWIMGYQEMEQVAATAFLGELERYDPEWDTKLTTKSEKRLRGAVWDHLRRLDPLSKDQRRLIRKIETVQESYLQQHHHEPSREELARALGIPEQHVEELLLLREVNHRISLEGVIDDEPISFMDTPFALTHFAVQQATVEQWSPEEQQVRMLDAEKFRQAIQELPTRERVIMELHYQKDYSLAEIGRLLGVTAPRVMQLRDEIVEKVRANFSLKNSPLRGAISPVCSAAVDR